MILFDAFARLQHPPFPDDEVIRGLLGKLKTIFSALFLLQPASPLDSTWLSADTAPRLGNL